MNYNTKITILFQGNHLAYKDTFCCSVCCHVYLVNSIRFRARFKSNYC